MITDLPTKAYVSTITVRNIYQSFAYKMAAKINSHRYGTNLRHCNPMYNDNINCVFNFPTLVPNTSSNS